MASFAQELIKKQNMKMNAEQFNVYLNSQSKMEAVILNQRAEHASKVAVRNNINEREEEECRKRCRARDDRRSIISYYFINDST